MLCDASILTALARSGDFVAVSCECERMMVTTANPTTDQEERRIGVAGYSGPNLANFSVLLTE